MKGGVRITGGVWRGRRLSVAGDVRPSSARLREALASRWLTRLDGASVLDLYAGSGVVGLELLGRGAARVVAVDSSFKVVRRLTRVAREWGISGLEARQASVPRGLASLGGGFDLVFADPPYERLERLEVGLDLIRGVAPLLAADAEFALEVRSRIELIEAVDDLELIDRRRYGDSTLAIYRRLAARK